MIYIYTDGASRGNPGRSASGYRILDEGRGLVAKHAFYNGIKTNNEAEYLAIIAALERAGKEFGYGIEVNLFSDSELVVKQLNGTYKVRKGHLQELARRARELVGRFRGCNLENLPREDENISAVDSGLNSLLDEIEKRGDVG